MGGGAWPFLVRGVICLVNSDNERDSNILNRCIQDYDIEAFHTLLLYMVKWFRPFDFMGNIVVV